MPSLTTIPHLGRDAVVALVLIIAAGLLFGPAGLRPEPRSAEAAFLSEVKKLLASNAQPKESFGISVAISGDTAVVGHCGSSNCGAPTTGVGAAYVFQRDEGGAHNWGEVTKLTPSDAGAGDNFGYSVAVDGDTAVVGADWEDAGGTNAGAAYVFQRNEGGADNWGEVKKLTASDAEANDRFGEGVAVSGDTVVVGAWLEDAGGLNDAGAAYVFQRDQGGADNWGEVKKLIASDAWIIDYFGTSVAVSADIVVAGAWGEDDGGGQAGAAYVFQRDQGGQDNWGEVKKLTASDAGVNDLFGASAAISGDTAVVGAFEENVGGTGAAYVFQRDQGGQDNWGEVKRLTASDAQAGDVFSESLAISGDTAVVGAFGEDTEGSYTGAAYVFQRDEGGAGNWGEVKKLTASDAEAGDLFGGSVTVSGGTAVVGAFGEDAGGTDAGAAYVFQTKLPEPGDKDGDGCTDEQENGPDETLGGLRQWFNPWDFYDVAGGGGGPPDQIIDLSNDIFGVIIHYYPNNNGGANPYPAGHEVFDRGPSTGPNPWNMTAPDGVVDLSNDILGVIQQYLHSCQ